MPSSEKQLQYMQDFLINIAKGDFDARLTVSNESNEDMVAMQVGINMLVEELKTSTISRVYLNSIYDGINDILIVIDEKGEIQKINHLVETLLLYSEQELTNKPLDKVLEIGDYERVKEYIKKAFEKGEIQEAGLNFITKDNTKIPVSCSFSALYNKLNQPSGVLLVAKNITALLHAKNQLQDKNDELNLFVYKASHDLKGPVSSMQGIMNLVDKSNDVKELKMYFKLMEECTSKLDTIISDLLVLGKVTYGDLQYETIDVRSAIDEIWKQMEYIEGAKETKLNIHIHEQAAIIKTEKELLHTILTNLIENGIKYRQSKAPDSNINIDIAVHNKGLLFTIADNGIGIEDSLQENIFKMFYRATYTSKGSGLGLYIVKMSALKLGGHVSFTSTLGMGTTFSLYIPSQ